MNNLLLDYLNRNHPSLRTSFCPSSSVNYRKLNLAHWPLKITNQITVKEWYKIVYISEHLLSSRYYPIRFILSLLVYNYIKLFTWNPGFLVIPSRCGSHDVVQYSISSSPEAVTCFLFFVS